MVSINAYKAPLKSPFSTCIWIADTCNLSCQYCYASPFSGKFMETKRLYELIDELIELDVFGIVIAGGEPFMHPDVLRIIDHAVNTGMQVGVLSNGICLDERTRNTLAQIVSGKKFILQISLDSIDPSINDITRGYGGQVIENIKALSRLGIKMQIATVLTSHNIDSAHLIIKEFYPGVKRFHFLNVQRTNKALRNPDILLSDTQAYEFWMRLRDYAKQFPSDLFLPSLRIMMRGFGEELEREKKLHQQATFACRSCSVGLTNINIDSNFNVLGCDIAKDFTKMGNISSRSFMSVWNSYEAFKVRNSPFPPCYRIKNSAQESLQDYLKPEYLKEECCGNLFVG